MLLGKFILRVDLSKLNNLGDVFADKRDFKPTLINKIGMVCIIAFLVLLMVPEFMPDTLPVTIFLKKFGLVGVVAVMVVVLAIIRDEKGKPLIDTGKTFSMGMAWSLLLTIMAILVFTGAIVSDKTGISATLVSFAQSIFGNVPGGLLIIAAVLLSFIGSNTIQAGVILGILIPILVPIAAGIGLNGPLVGVLIALSSCGSFFLPNVSSQAVFIHTQEWVGKYNYKLVTAMVLLTLVLLFVVGIPVAQLLF